MFDREFYRNSRERAKSKFADYDFLFRACSKDIEARIESFDKTFENALIYSPNIIKSSAGNTIYADLIKSHDACTNISDEHEINFPDNSLDLIVSNLSMHFSNDILQILLRYHKMLKCEGVFICSMFGGETLSELRSVMQEADNKMYSGTWPHIVPFVKIKDGARLLVHSKFQNPVSDTISYKVQYKDILSLVRDIRGMGQSNCLSDRKKTIYSKKYLQLVDRLYRAKHQNIIATFEIITITGTKGPPKKQKL